MKAQNSQKISVVIPCYNEEANISACLSAVFDQIEPVYEVIVVDNNCTDNTIKIARTFPRVKIIKEPEQGLIPARNSGMNLAKGDIIARIDVDTRLTKTWSINLRKSFDDDTIMAVTGTGYFYDAPLKKIVKTFRNIMAVHANRLILGHNMLWGSNMAIRRSAWLVTKASTCNQPNIMEDLDLARHIYEDFGKSAISYNPHLEANISGRRAMAGLKSHYLYLKMWPATLRMHGQYSYPLSWPIILLVLALSVPGSATMRLYDPQKGRVVFSRSYWRQNRFDRPNP